MYVIAVQLSDVVKSPVAVQEFMTKKIGLPTYIAEAILQSSLNYIQVCYIYCIMYIYHYYICHSVQLNTSYHSIAAQLKLQSYWHESKW